MILWKWVNNGPKPLRYPNDISDAQEFFYRACFNIQVTPKADPYLEELDALFAKRPRKEFGFKL